MSHGNPGYQTLQLSVSVVFGRKKRREHTSKHSSTSPATLAALVHAGQTGEEVLVVDTGLLGLTQFISKDVEHELTVTVSVDVTVSLEIQVLPKLSSVDQVTVVRKADTVRAVHVERLSLGIGTGSRGRVSQVTNSHESREVGDLSTILEDLGSHTVGLHLVESTPRRTCCDTGCILTTIYAERLASRSHLSIFWPKLTLEKVECLVEVHGSRR